MTDAYLRSRGIIFVKGLFADHGPQALRAAAIELGYIVVVPVLIRNDATSCYYNTIPSLKYIYLFTHRSVTSNKSTITNRIAIKEIHFVQKKLDYSILYPVNSISKLLMPTASSWANISTIIIYLKSIVARLSCSV